MIYGIIILTHIYGLAFLAQMKQITGIYNSRDVPSINNIPSSCYQTISWNITITNLFEFGGNKIDTKKQSRDLDDLWKLNLLNLAWIWISGYNLSRKSGTYRQKRSFFQI